jgi:membrane-bound metal-dependent hydrolase YbcI (DUF457 family)
LQNAVRVRKCGSLLYSLGFRVRGIILENIAHTFLGSALAQAGLKKLSGMGMATLVIAANLPDIDLVWSFYSYTSYLIHHRGFTHSFIGIIPQMFILSAIMYFFGKWQKSKDPEKPDVNFGGLLLLSCLGLLSHLGLDYLNDYGIRPYLPVNETKFFSASIFILDAWFWLLLGGYTFLTINLTRLVLILFSLFALISSLLIAFFPELPSVSRIIYLAGVLLLIACRRKFGRLENRSLGITAFSLFFLYNIIVVQLRTAAEKRFSEAKTAIISRPVERFLLSPVALNPFRWNFIAANKEYLYLGSISSLKPERQITGTLPTNFSDPLVRKTLETETGQVMQYFTDYLYAYKKTDEQWVYVYLRDARYIHAGEKGFSTRVVKYPLSRALRKNDIERKR